MKFTPDSGIALRSDKYDCNLSLKVEIGMLQVDCSISETNQDLLKEFPDSKRLQGWKNLMSCRLQSHFNNETILEMLFQKLEVSVDQKAMVRDWLISALSYSSAPMLAPQLVYGIC